MFQFFAFNDFLIVTVVYTSPSTIISTTKNVTKITSVSSNNAANNTPNATAAATKSKDSEKQVISKDVAAKSTSESSSQQIASLSSFFSLSNVNQEKFGQPKKACDRGNSVSVRTDTGVKPSNQMSQFGFGDDDNSVAESNTAEENQVEIAVKHDAKANKPASVGTDSHQSSSLSSSSRSTSANAHNINLQSSNQDGGKVSTVENGSQVINIDQSIAGTEFSAETNDDDADAFESYTSTASCSPSSICSAIGQSITAGCVNCYLFLTLTPVSRWIPDLWLAIKSKSYTYGKLVMASPSARVVFAVMFVKLILMILLYHVYNQQHAAHMDEQEFKSNDPEHIFTSNVNSMLYESRTEENSLRELNNAHHISVMTICIILFLFLCIPASVMYYRTYPQASMAFLTNTVAAICGMVTFVGAYLISLVIACCMKVRSYCTKQPVQESNTMFGSSDDL